MHEIKQVVKACKIFGFDIQTLQRYVDDGAPLNNMMIQKGIDTLINNYGKALVSEFIKEAIRNQERGQWITYDVEHQTLFKGKRTERVSDDDDPETAWGHYYKFLSDAGFTNIEEVKASAINILEMMKQDTAMNSPVRGAVIGNVQSGKTANMEALISMAADNGWNFFVILTGLTTNLMEQTRDRMLGGPS